MTSNKKRPINVERNAFEKFEQQYPNLKELYLTRCLILAVQKPEFFQSVLFDPIFREVK